jgi:hypothetical protein
LLIICPEIGSIMTRPWVGAVGYSLISAAKYDHQETNADLVRQLSVLTGIS